MIIGKLYTINNVNGIVLQKRRQRWDYAYIAFV